MPAARPALAVGGAAVVLAIGLTLDAAQEPGHPGEWDPLVEDLAGVVERERGLRFDHPVAVDFLDAEEYRERASGTDEVDAPPDEDDTADVDAGVVRALGLAEGELDLDATAADVADIGTLAFYDPTSSRITVRADDPASLPPDLRVTLVHELTHALQDQVFDIDALFEAAGEVAGGAVRGVIEGDAVRIEDGYIAQLSPDEQAAYDEATQAAVEDAEEGLADAPAAYLALFDAPYAFGRPFVAALDAPGDDDVDDAFDREHIPASEEQLADPARYLVDDEPTDVELPDAPSDEDVVDEGTVGWFALYLMLADRLDVHEALAATDGWDGDAYVATRDGDDDDRVCVDAAFATDSGTDRDELRGALTTWADGRDARVDVDGDLVLLHACDPGTDADIVRGNALDALALPVVRSYILADALTVFDVDDARCLAGEAAAQVDVTRIDEPLADQVYVDALAACGLD